MSLKDLPHERAGLGATLLVLMVTLGAMILIGVAVWMRMAPMGTPSQPNQAGKAHSELRIELRVPGRESRGNCEL